MVFAFYFSTEVAMIKRTFAATVFSLGIAQAANAALITDPNDARVWQGANVGTFAQLLYGSNTLANRQQIVDNQIMDDGIFNSSGYTAGTLIRLNGDNNPGAVLGNCGRSLDTNGPTPGYDGTYAYQPVGGCSGAMAGNAVDDLWLQTNNIIGHTVWDLGFQATKAAIFNTVDHGPLPQESIESTVYLSNDLVTWTQAVTERVWMEGFMTDTSVLWDGFAYAVGTGTNATFRYASVIWGGPGALLSDGDNEINGVMGLQGDFTGNPAPAPFPLALLVTGLLLLAGFRRSVRQAS
jgi:hypothetical protein